MFHLLSDSLLHAKLTVAKVQCFKLLLDIYSCESMGSCKNGPTCPSPTWSTCGMFGSSDGLGLKKIKKGPGICLFMVVAGGGRVFVHVSMQSLLMHRKSSTFQ